VPSKTLSKIRSFFTALLRGILGLFLVAAAAFFAWKLAFDLPTLRFGGQANRTQSSDAALPADHAAQVAKFAAGQLAARDRVMFAQAMLQALAFDPGPVDGLMGTQTLAAVRDFQSGQGGVATGTVDEYLLEALAAAVIAQGQDPMAMLKTIKK